MHVSKFGLVFVVCIVLICSVFFLLFFVFSMSSEYPRMKMIISHTINIRGTSLSICMCIWVVVSVFFLPVPLLSTQTTAKNHIFTERDVLSFARHVFSV